MLSPRLKPFSSGCPLCRGSCRCCTFKVSLDFLQLCGFWNVTSASNFGMTSRTMKNMGLPQAATPMLSSNREDAPATPSNQYNLLTLLILQLLYSTNLNLSILYLYLYLYSTYSFFLPDVTCSLTIIFSSKNSFLFFFTLFKTIFCSFLL